MSSSEQEPPGEYGIADPFEIDNGELNGLTPQECFTLGAEWGSLRRIILMSSDPITALIDPKNEGRILHMLYRNGRPAIATRLNEDWVRLEVPGG